jgi:uncharacterized protein
VSDRRDWRARLDGLEVEEHGDWEVHVARRFNERRRGLAGLDDLPAGHALHILRCSSVHTVGMRFALDLLWLDRAGAVKRVDRDVPAFRNRLCLGASSVIEARAGGADALLAAGYGPEPAS